MIAHTLIATIAIAITFFATLSSATFLDRQPSPHEMTTTASPATPKAKKKFASSSSSSAMHKVKSFLPDWTNNIHRVTTKACTAIRDYRLNSPVVKKLVERNASNNKNSNNAGEASLQAFEQKLKRANEADSTNDLEKSVGYNVRRYFSRGAAATPKLLCLGFSHMDANGQQETNLVGAYNAWAKHCDDVLLYTKLRPEKLPGVPKEHIREIHPIQGDHPGNLWQKIRLVLAMLADQTQDGAILQRNDFVVWFTDDSFFSVGNTKALLMEPYVQAADRLGALLLLGHRMNDNKNIFVSNLGYVMNRALVRVMADLVNTPACDPMAQSGSDDIQIGKCLGAYGVIPFDTYDELGEARMSLWEPDMLQYSLKHGMPDWYVRYRARPIPKSLAVLGVHAIAFHGVNDDTKRSRLQNLVG